MTQIDGARVVPAEVLGGVFRKYTDAEIIVQPDVEQAFETALAKRGEGMLFCAGSLYLVGDIKAILKKKSEKFSYNRDFQFPQTHSVHRETKKTKIKIRQWNTISEKSRRSGRASG